MKKIGIACVFLLGFLAAASSGQEKFVPVYRGARYEVSVNQNTLREQKGIVSVWLRYDYTPEGKASLRSQLPKKIPAKYRNKEIGYSMENFLFNKKNGRYMIKMLALHDAEGNAFYREASSRWLPARPGTLAERIAQELAAMR